MGVWVRGCVGVLLVLMALLPSSQAITIHPAVLKNFVGPYRKPGEPVLRSALMGEGSPSYLRQRWAGEGGSVGGPAVAFSKSRQPQALVAPERVYPLAMGGVPAPPREWNRPLRSCTGSASCTQNMDNTLNLLMRMMETGRRR